MQLAMAGWALEGRIGRLGARPWGERSARADWYASSSGVYNVCLCRCN